MYLSRNRLYGFLGIACLAGYVWIYLNFSSFSSGNYDNINVCLIKHFTNVPCPSCGSTRSVLAILKGDFLQGFYFNPFGYILILILIILPLWLSYDYFKQKNTFFRFYTRTETFLQQKKTAIPAILLVLVNWFWNIYKGL
jgi:hypothetical protein